MNNQKINIQEEEEEKKEEEQFLCMEELSAQSYDDDEDYAEQIDYASTIPEGMFADEEDSDKYNLTKMIIQQACNVIEEDEVNDEKNFRKIQEEKEEIDSFDSSASEGNVDYDYSVSCTKLCKEKKKVRSVIVKRSESLQYYRVVPRFNFRANFEGQVFPSNVIYQILNKSNMRFCMQITDKDVVEFNQEEIKTVMQMLGFQQQPVLYNDILKYYNFLFLFLDTSLIDKYRQIFTFINQACCCLSNKEITDKYLQPFDECIQSTSPCFVFDDFESYKYINPINKINQHYYRCSAQIQNLGINRKNCDKHFKEYRLLQFQTNHQGFNIMKKVYKDILSLVIYRDSILFQLIYNDDYEEEYIDNFQYSSVNFKQCKLLQDYCELLDLISTILSSQIQIIQYLVKEGRMKVLMHCANNHSSVFSSMNGRMGATKYHDSYFEEWFGEIKIHKVQQLKQLYSQIENPYCQFERVVSKLYSIKAKQIIQLMKRLFMVFGRWNLLAWEILLEHLFRNYNIPYLKQDGSYVNMLICF